jgi:hypothetical protein
MQNILTNLYNKVLLAYTWLCAHQNGLKIAGILGLAIVLTGASFSPEILSGCGGNAVGKG